MGPSTKLYTVLPVGRRPRVLEKLFHRLADGDNPHRVWILVTKDSPNSCRTSGPGLAEGPLKP